MGIAISVLQSPLRLLFLPIVDPAEARRLKDSLRIRQGPRRLSGGKSMKRAAIDLDYPNSATATGGEDLGKKLATGTMGDS